MHRRDSVRAGNLAHGLTGFVLRCEWAATQTPYGTGVAPKWRLANARPEPDFRYFSNRSALVSSANMIATLRRHGRCLAECGQGPALCHARRMSTFAVMPV